MSPRQAFASALHLFVVFAFFFGGVFFVALPYLPELKTHLFEKCTLIGLSLFIASLILLLGFYALDRGRYLVLKMGVSTDINIVRQSVEDCFARQFPKKISLMEIDFGRKSRIEIKVSIAVFEEEAREALFIAAENHLGALFRERFGYSQPFLLIVRV